MKQIKFSFCITLTIITACIIIFPSYAITYENYLQANSTSIQITSTQINQLNWGPIYDSETVGSTLKQYVMHSVYSTYQNTFKTVTLNMGGRF